MAIIQVKENAREIFGLLVEYKKFHENATLVPRVVLSSFFIYTNPTSDRYLFPA